MIKITCVAVMDRMCATPNVIRREGENAQNAPNPITERAVVKEGTMPAIMLDAEHPQQKCSVQKSDAKGSNIAKICDPKRHRPKRDKGNNTYAQLETAAERIWLAILGEDWHPFAGIFLIVGSKI